ncbi:hypothetical protein [Pseudomonas aeruginosa]|uniref:hypothetical protein n=1 Tax=Pseudomonas aeruginosa TaxID=287 RepID=UPI000F51E16B|nr:hypothetical protein [Pseudomonas aeruginosa]RQB97285.1 hypothetical protein IPC404_29200 [Pseudomonas aeruginosa]
MSIDWSKAPDGATHAGIIPSRNRNTNVWYRDIDPVRGRYEYFSLMDESWHISGGSPLAQELIPRPAESAPAALTWDGQGLPPVGTVCEIKHRDIGWVRCEIVAHKSFSCGGLTLAIAWIDENTLDQSQGVRFRPIHTPDQIAAEEREKAVGDMAMSIQGVPYQYPTLYALYDAGYRRQEEGK